MAEGVNFKVLAVDDSLVTLKILKKIIKDSEFEIIAEATSGEDAITKYDLCPCFNVSWPFFSSSFKPSNSDHELLF